MDAQQVKVFIDAMAASDLSELSASKDGWTLRLVRGAARDATAAASHAGTSAAAAAPAPAAPADRCHDLCAALAGTVFLHPRPGARPFVQLGQEVSAGQTLCLIEAMKVFNEVAAERAGVVEAILVASGEEVSAGQALMRLRVPGAP